MKKETFNQLKESLHQALEYERGERTDLRTTHAMKYKDYRAVVTFDEKANIFYGEVSFIRDVITFQGKTTQEIKQAFANSVEDYLAFCKGKEEEETSMRF
jgi:predicted RNase H-like HicB family nuclease